MVNPLLLKVNSDAITEKISLEAALQPTYRLFFAIIPTKAAAARIIYQGEHLRDEYGLKGKLFAGGALARCFKLFR